MCIICCIISMTELKVLITAALSARGQILIRLWNNVNVLWTISAAHLINVKCRFRLLTASKLKHKEVEIYPRLTHWMSSTIKSVIHHCTVVSTVSVHECCFCLCLTLCVNIWSLRRDRCIGELVCFLSVSTSTHSANRLIYGRATGPLC